MDFKTNNENHFKNKMKQFNKYNVYNLMYLLSIFQTEFLFHYNDMEYLRKHPYTFPWVHEDIAMYKFLNNSEGYFMMSSIKDMMNFVKLIWNEDSAHDILVSVQKYSPDSINRLFPSLVEKQTGYRFYFEYFLVKSFHMLNTNELIKKICIEVFKIYYYSFFKVIVQYYSSLIMLHKEIKETETNSLARISDFFEKFRTINDELMTNLTFLEKLTMNIEEYRVKQLNLLEKTNWDYYNCFNYLRCKPIIKIDECVVCPLPLALIKSFMFYIYNEFTYGSDERRDLLGKEYEKYIYTIMKNTVRKGSVYREISYLGKKSSDVILSENDNLLFIECKFKSIPFDYRNIENISKKKDLIEQYAIALNQIVMNFIDASLNKIPDLPTNVPLNNMYGVVLIQELANIPKKEIINFYFEKYTCDSIEKDFIMKHVHFVDDEFFEEYVLNENIDFFKILYSHTVKEDPNDILNLSSNHKEGETWASIEADKIYKKMFSE